MKPSSILPFIYVTDAPAKLKTRSKVDRIVHFTETAINLISELYRDVEYEIPILRAEKPIEGNTVDEVFDNAFKQKTEAEIIDEEAIEAIMEEFEEEFDEIVSIMQCCDYFKQHMDEKSLIVVDEEIANFTEEPFALGIKIKKPRAKKKKDGQQL